MREMALWSILTPYEVPFYYFRYPNPSRTKKGSENVLKSFKKVVDVRRVIVYYYQYRDGQGNTPSVNLGKFGERLSAIILKLE